MSPGRARGIDQSSYEQPHSFTEAERRLTRCLHVALSESEIETEHQTRSVSTDLLCNHIVLIVRSIMAAEAVNPSLTSMNHTIAETFQIRFDSEWDVSHTRRLLSWQHFGFPLHIVLEPRWSTLEPALLLSLLFWCVLWLVSPGKRSQTELGVKIFSYGPILT